MRGTARSIHLPHSAASARCGSPLPSLAGTSAPATSSEVKRLRRSSPPGSSTTHQVPTSSVDSTEMTVANWPSSHTLASGSSVRGENVISIPPPRATSTTVLEPLTEPGILASLARSSADRENTRLLRPGSPQRREVLDADDPMRRFPSVVANMLPPGATWHLSRRTLFPTGAGPADQQGAWLVVDVDLTVDGGSGSLVGVDPRGRLRWRRTRSRRASP